MQASFGRTLLLSGLIAPGSQSRLGADPYRQPRGAARSWIVNGLHHRPHDQMSGRRPAARRPQETPISAERISAALNSPCGDLRGANLARRAARQGQTFPGRIADRLHAGPQGPWGFLRRRQPRSCPRLWSGFQRRRLSVAISRWSRRSALSSWGQSSSTPTFRDRSSTKANFTDAVMQGCADPLRDLPGCVDEGLQGLPQTHWQHGKPVWETYPEAARRPLPRRISEMGAGRPALSSHVPSRHVQGCGISAIFAAGSPGVGPCRGGGASALLRSPRHDPRAAPFPRAPHDADRALCDHPRRQCCGTRAMARSSSCT